MRRSSSRRTRSRSGSRSPATAPAIKGSFFNGDEKVTSTSGTLENGSLTLNFDEYGTKLIATVKDGALEGEYNRGTRGAPYPFHAKRFTPVPVGDTNDPVDRRPVERPGEELEGRSRRGS